MHGSWLTVHADLSTDKVGEDSLVGITAGIFGTLDQTKNHISYPNSVYDNVKGAGEQTPGGGGEAPSPSSTEPPAAPTSTAPAPGPTKTCKASKK